jgi:GT2 family glycosyltransferase
MNQPTTTKTRAFQAPNVLPESSLILCSRNRPDLLAQTVESILEGDHLPDELIIIDQSTTPHPTLADVRTTHGCAVRYIWTEDVGLCRANNLGITAARHDLLVFTHDDIKATPQWYGTIVRAVVEAGPRSVVFGRVLPETADQPGGFAPSTIVREEPAVYRGRIYDDVLYPLNMAMFRSTFDEVGLFDERLGPGTPYPAAEDNDFGFRVLEHGYQIVYAPEAVIYHRAWRTSRDYLPLRWSYGRGQGAFYAKHLSLRDRYIVRRVLRELIQHTLRLSLVLRGQRRAALGSMAYMLGLLSGAIQWCLTGRKTNGGRPFSITPPMVRAKDVLAEAGQYQV